MASRRTTVDFILEQIAGAGTVDARAMFGEYGVYCDGKMTALICDDRLFIKPSLPAQEFLGDWAMESPYKGAKPCFVIPVDRWDDRDWMSELVRRSASGLPPPKSKPAAKPARKSR